MQTQPMLAPIQGAEARNHSGNQEEAQFDEGPPGNSRWRRGLSEGEEIAPHLWRQQQKGQKGLVSCPLPTAITGHQ